jgi:hypothetical protein
MGRLGTIKLSVQALPGSLHGHIQQASVITGYVGPWDMDCCCRLLTAKSLAVLVSHPELFFTQVFRPWKHMHWFGKEESQTPRPLHGTANNRIVKHHSTETLMYNGTHRFIACMLAFCLYPKTRQTENPTHMSLPTTWWLCSPLKGFVQIGMSNTEVSQRWSRHTPSPWTGNVTIIFLFYQRNSYASGGRDTCPFRLKSMRNTYRHKNDTYGRYILHMKGFFMPARLCPSPSLSLSLSLCVCMVVCVMPQ